jgi:glycosyltransferase 2 family protein
LRGWLVARRGVAVRAAWHSIVLERGLMLLGLLSLLCLTQDQATQRLGFVTGVQLLLAAVVGAAALLFVADRLLPSRWAWARTLVADTRAVAASPWGAGAMMVSLVSNLNFVAAGVLLAPVVGMSFSWGDGLVIIPLMTAVTTLPISLGGWGVREGVLVTLLARLGVPADTALIYSLLFGLGGVMAGLPGFLAWWLDGPNGAAA